MPRRASSLGHATLDRNDPVKMGVKFAQVHPEINPYNLIPNATFGGVTNPPTFTIGNPIPLLRRNMSRDRTIYRAFNAAAVKPPDRSNYGIGNAPRDAIRGPS